MSSRSTRYGPSSVGAAAPSPSVGEVTALLRAWQNGDHEAAERLFELLEGSLRDIASRTLSHHRERRRELQTTELVAELYLSLERYSRAPWESRGHFLCVAAKIARSVVVDHERERRSLKRGGAVLTVPLLDLEPRGEEAPRVDLLAVDEALVRLEEIDADAAKVVELKFFAGLELAEIASVLEASRSSVIRRWRYARAWLHNQLRA